MCKTNLSEVTLAVPVEIRLCEKKMPTQSSFFQTSIKYALERERLTSIRHFQHQLCESGDLVFCVKGTREFSVS